MNMSKYINVSENGDIEIRLTDETLDIIKDYRRKYGEKAYDSIMEIAEMDIEETMEYIEGYCYGWGELCCMTWASADYHDLYYSFHNDMIYDFCHYDIFHKLCEGKALKLKGRKPYDDECRKDILAWAAEENGWGYEESEVI